MAIRLSMQYVASILPFLFTEVLFQEMCLLLRSPTIRTESFCDRGLWGRVLMTVAGTLRRIVVCDFSVDIDRRRKLPDRRGLVDRTGRAVCCV